MCLIKNLHVMTEVPSAICVRFSQEHFLFVFLQWKILHCPLNVVGVRTISTSPRDSVTRTAATKTSPSPAFKWSLITVTNLCRGEGKKKKKKTYLFVFGGVGEKNQQRESNMGCVFSKEDENNKPVESISGGPHYPNFTRPKRFALTPRVTRWVVLAYVQNISVRT